MLGELQAGVPGDDRLGPRAGAGQQRLVVGEPGDAKLARKTRLPGSEQLALGRRRAQALAGAAFDVGLLDQRAHDERLAARAELAAESLVSRGTRLLARDERGLDGSATLRALMQRDRVQVPVARERER